MAIAADCKSAAPTGHWWFESICVHQEFMFGTRGENPKINPPRIVDTRHELQRITMPDKQPYDYAHMKRMLDSLMVAWKKNPYLRLGQLVVNAVGHRSLGQPLNGPDLFYIENDELASAVIKFSEDTCPKSSG
jgi:hypothetical protein